MDTTRIVITDDGTTDIWRATDLEYLDFWERATHVGELYEKWRSLETSGPTPPASDAFDPLFFDVESTVSTEPAQFFRPNIFYADARPDAPMDFRITVPGANICRRPLCDLFSPILRDALFSDLSFCQGTQEPMYQQIYQKISKVEQCYVRLLLPAVDGRNFVSRVYGICRPLYAERELIHWGTL